MSEIRRLFDGHSDLHPRVFYVGDDPLARIEIRAVDTDTNTIRDHESEIRASMERGHLRAAFVLAWPLLEASLRSLMGVATHPGRTDTLVRALAMQGYIEPDTERRIRGLIDLTNRIIHGDLKAEPSAADVETVLSAIDETLSASVS